MKLSVKYFLSLSVLASVLCLSACNKKWKKPTEVAVRFQLNQNSSADIIKFTHASLILTKISVSADRKQSPSHVDLQQTVNSKNDFFVNSPSQIYRFDVPQGSYTSFNLSYETSNDENANGLQIDGTYTDSTGITFAVQFIFTAGDVNTLMSKNTSGGNEITLVEGHAANATIYINPTYWFASISNRMMEDVDVTMVNNMPTIIIGEDNNDDIYRLVVSRIKDGNECIIK